MTSHPDPGPRRSGLTRLLTLGSLLWLGGLLTVSQAQVTLDGSLGPGGPLAGPHYRIGAELGQSRGGNLFHSFGAFNVPRGGSATFTGPNTIANILSRVTGGQPSAIDGLLRSEIAGANLYLLNPSGVLFGPNASLDVSGSVHVSTADYLRFADGATFFATLGQASVLTVAEPAAFGFLGPNPAAVTIQGSQLAVHEGKALSVVGGDIAILGHGGPLTNDSVPTLHAPSGRLQLASVASPGEVGFSPLELAPDLQVDGFARLGRIALTQGAFLDVSGNGGGTVLLRGGHLRVDHSNVFAENLGPVDGMGLGLDMRITADAVLANGALLSTDTLAAGRARDLQVTAGSLHLTGVSRIHSQTFGAGRGGDLTVTATEAIEIVGPASGLAGYTFEGGDAGRLVVSAPRLTLNRGVITTSVVPYALGRAGDLTVEVGRLTLLGGQISTATSGLGRGGDLTITATEAIEMGHSSVLFSDTSGRGDAGRLVVSAPRLTMTGGSQINGATNGFWDRGGRGGDLTVTATEAIEIAGPASGILSFSYLPGGGDAGRILVSAPRLTLTGGAFIDSGTWGSGRGGEVTVAATEAITISGRDSLGPSGLYSNAFGSGDAGRLVVSAPLLTLTDGAQLNSNTLGAGHGGTISVQARQIELSTGGTISSSSARQGNAGNIVIQAGQIFRSQHGAVTTAAEHSDGGTIQLTAGSLVDLRESQITATVRGGVGLGGNITLDTQSMVLEGSQIRADAFGGPGGNVRIVSDVLLTAPAPASLVSASSERGISGTVDIRAPVTSLGGTLASLPQAFVPAAALLPARCAARAQDGRYSSLVLGGREGLPPEPGGLLPSPLTLEERLVADPAMRGAPPQQTSAARFALLAGHEQGLPRLGCPP